MVSKGNLKMALASQQGTNWKHISQKKRHKASRRRKRLREEKARNEAREDSEHRSEDDESGDQDAWDGPDTGAETEDENGGVPVADEDSVENEEVGSLTFPHKLHLLKHSLKRRYASAKFDYDALNESDSESEMEVEENVARQAESKAQSWPNGQKRENGAQKAKDEEGNEDDDENQKPIPMSDLESLPSSDREDLVPYQRLTINKTSALLASLKRIQIPTDKSASFASHMTVVVPGAPTADSIKDFNDDIQRETAFFRQAQVGAHEGRRLLRKESVPFTRPRDYFAEMVKDDGHMDKVKAQLIQEATNKKAAAEARKLRDLKKFGKQVQVAKLQDRQRQKRETLEKIKALKKSLFSPKFPRISVP